MTKQQIIELLQASRWTPDIKSKTFIDDEFSETLAIWDNRYAFIVYGVRNNRCKDAVLLVVTQLRPGLRFDVPFDVIEYTLNNNNMKHMFSGQLLNDKEEHNNFLKG